MGHYKSNVRDQVFNLFEVYGVDTVLGTGAYADFDAETATEMLAEMARLAEGPVAESFEEGDRNPPVFDPKTHTVTLPEAFKKSVRAVIEGGWDKLGIDEELGGTPMPRALSWALQEHILGANPAVYMYAMGAGFADIFYQNCFKNGLLPVKVTQEQLDALMAHAERGANATLTVDLPNQTISGADGEPVHFEIDQGLKHMLVEGLDEIGLTMQKSASVAAHETRLSEQRPWI